MEELFQKYIYASHFNFEGSRGIRNLKHVIDEVCGYDNRYGTAIEDFLKENPGAIESIVTWVSEQPRPEWKARLERMVDEEHPELHLAEGDHWIDI
jgi:hypothetical protein